MTRVRLPDRRFAETVALEHGGQPSEEAVLGQAPVGERIFCRDIRHHH